MMTYEKALDILLSVQDTLPKGADISSASRGDSSGDAGNTDRTETKRERVSAK